MKISKERTDIIERILDELYNYTENSKSIGSEEIYMNCRRELLSKLDVYEWLGIISIEERSAYIEYFDNHTLGYIKTR